MKQAISLVEVLVSVMLITTVIASVLQMKNNNLFFLDKFQKSSLNNSYINLTVQNNNSDKKRNEKFYLNQIVDFNDDTIRKELKKIKVTLKDTLLKDIQIPENNYIKSISIVESKYTLVEKNKTLNQNFYTFKLEQ